MPFTKQEIFVFFEGHDKTTIPPPARLPSSLIVHQLLPLLDMQTFTTLRGQGPGDESGLVVRGQRQSGHLKSRLRGIV